MKYSILLLVFFSNLSLALNGDFHITSVGISDGTDTIYIGVTPDFTGSSCSKDFEMRLDMNTSGIYKEVYSAAIAALVADREVNINYSDSVCLYDAPALTTFQIQ